MSGAVTSCTAPRLKSLPAFKTATQFQQRRQSRVTQRTRVCCFAVVSFMNVSKYISRQLWQDYIDAINNGNGFLLNCLLIKHLFVGCFCQNMVELQL